MRESMKEIINLLKAGNDCIWVQTVEEEIFLQDLRKALLNSDSKILESTPISSWSPATGVTKYYPNGTVNEDVRLRNYEALMQNKIIPAHDDEIGTNNIWLLHGIVQQTRNFLTERYIRDIKEGFSSSFNPIIIVAKEHQIPSEIEHLFRYVKYDLPDVNEFMDLLIETNDNLLAKHDCKKSKEELLTIANACVGMTFKHFAQAIKDSLVKYQDLDLRFLMDNKIQLIKKTGVLKYIEPSIRLSDIGGHEDLKEWLQAQKEFSSKEALEFGVDKPKGFLSVGLAGSGKTAIAEAFAGELGLPLLEFSISKIMSRFVGESEQKIVMALDIVKKCAPCVLLLDEVEKILGGATVSSNQVDGGVTNRVLQELLKFMNSNDSGVYVIMTSNDASQLPPEFTRSGRIDAQWYFGYPSKEEIKEIVNIYLDKKNKAIDPYYFDELVDRLINYTGAEIKQVVIGAIKYSFLRVNSGEGDEILDSRDFERALEEVIPIYKSAKEKTIALEAYYKDRARRTSKLKTEPKKAFDDVMNFDFNF